MVLKFLYDKEKGKGEGVLHIWRYKVWKCRQEEGFIFDKYKFFTTDVMVVFNVEILWGSLLYV